MTSDSFKTIFPLAPQSGCPTTGSIAPTYRLKLYVMPLASERTKDLYHHLFGFLGLYVLRVCFPLNGIICSSMLNFSSIGTLLNADVSVSTSGQILYNLSVHCYLIKCKNRFIESQRFLRSESATIFTLQDIHSNTLYMKGVHRLPYTLKCQ